MDRDEEITMVDVPEQEHEDLVITVKNQPECTSDEPSSWAERVAQVELTTSHNDENFRPTYPNHLMSEILAFDGVLQNKSFGESPLNDQQRFQRLNIVPNLARPVSRWPTIRLIQGSF